MKAGLPHGVEVGVPEGVALRTKGPIRVGLIAVVGSLAVLTPALLHYSVTNGEERAVRAELDAFSGLPNPHWDLTAEEAGEFLMRFRKLPEDKGGKSLNEGLGYRGLIVTRDGNDIGGYDDIVIYNELVIARRAGKLHRFTDKDRDLELWLFKTSKGRIENNLFERFLSEIRPKP